MLADKTGSLIATAAQFGAEFAGVDPHVVDVLRRVRRADRRGLPALRRHPRHRLRVGRIGQDAGHRSARGHPTLPVLYALRSEDPDDARLRELVSGPLADDSLHAEALALLRVSAAVAEARRTLQSYADASRAMLAALPARPARDALEALTDVVVARTS